MSYNLAGLNVDLSEVTLDLFQNVFAQSISEDILTPNTDPDRPCLRPNPPREHNNVVYCRRTGCRSLPTRYQTQRLIQNTVRVPHSLYVANVAALNVYQQPENAYRVVAPNQVPYLIPPRIQWNQMSDRAMPHHQVAHGMPGSTYHASSTKHSITRLRPGALAPGGIGVDIKHNSYDRYLNRLKGKGPIKQGYIPPGYQVESSGTGYIPFNRAYPIYGDKIVKTGIVTMGCPTC
jgi:hypothetical protein